MKRILLTWASSGLGLELAKLFTEKGYEVIALGRHKPALDIPHISLDLTSGESIQHCVQEIHEKYSDFSCLLHCAGDGKVQLIQEVEYAEAETTFKLNAIGPLTLTTWLFDLIKKNESDVIVIVASIGVKWVQHMTTYGGSKWWMRWLVENLQAELKWTKSRITGVYPWQLDTQSMSWPNGRKSQLEKITGKKETISPMDPKEIAKIVFDIYALPKNIEISEIIINRK